MEQISKPKSPLKFLYASIYFMSYFTRYAYSAVMAELIVYGVSQIFSGILGDKIQPKYVIAIGLVGLHWSICPWPGCRIFTSWASSGC